MFVAINNSEMNVPQVLDWINRTKNANDNIISPKFAMEILSKTNFFGHIKTVLKNIKENCKTKEDILPYKEFILSCVDSREMSDQAMADLQELVKLCGCEEEFNLANRNKKIYPKDVCRTICVGSEKELKEAIANGFFVSEAIIKDSIAIGLSNTDLSRVFRLSCSTSGNVYLNNSSLPCEIDIISKSIDFSGSNFSKVKKVTWVGDEYSDLTIDLSETVNLPAIDLSNAKNVKMTKCDLRNFDEFKFKDEAYVNLSYSYNFPKVVDVSNADVDLEWCNFAGVEKIIFGKEAKLYGAKNLYKNLDFRGCDFVRLSEANLEGVEEIIFGKCGMVNMSSAKNLCKVIDVSNCNKAFFARADFAGVEKFVVSKDVVVLGKATNLPKILDLSNCDEVICSETDLTGVEEIKFKKGASVYLRDSCNLPKKLDFSMCDTVHLRDCDFSGVKEVKFRDEAQMEDCMDKVKNFTGEFKYGKKQKIKNDIRRTVINVMSKIYGVE